MNPSRDKSTVLVVGAGIFGVTAARELARRGFAVTLVDPGPLPRPEAASSDFSKLVRADYGADRLYTLLMRDALPGWRAWNEEFGETLFHETGVLFLTKRPLRPGDFEYESIELLKEHGFPIVPLDAGGVAAHYPRWSGHGWAAAYFNPQAGWAAAERTLSVLTSHAQLGGVTLEEGVAMAGLIEEGGRVRGITDREGREHRADLTIVAAGAWTPVLLPQLEGSLKILGQPVVYLQVDRIQDWQPPRFPPWAADISTTGWYGFPALPDGTLKFGNHGPGRVIDPEGERRVSPAEVQEARRFLNDRFPKLATAPLAGTRLCPYCDSADGDFWIDHDPLRPGLMVATGGSGHAFKFAPVLGGIVADVAEGRVTALTGRFAWRDRSHTGHDGSRFMEQRS